jgi:hypothetical protein
VGIADAVAPSACPCRTGLPKVATSLVVKGAPPSSAVVVRSATPDVRLLSRELVTSSAVGGNGGNGWGAQKLRVARSATGDIFVVYPTGADNTNKTYILMHRAPTGVWSQVDSGDGGRETPLLLIGPRNTVYLVTWAGGSPSLVNEGVDSTGPRTVNSIPGSWQRDDNSPYAGAAIDTSGNLYVEENTTSNLTTDVPGMINLAWTTGGPSGRWHFTTLKPSIRFAYPFLLPDDSGGIDIVASSGVPWSSIGYSQPGDAFGYVFDRVYDWHTRSLQSTPLRATPVAYDPQPHGTSDYVHVFAQDAYRDTAGRVHILYTIQGPDTGQVIIGHHAILAHGSVIKNTRVADGYCPNEARMIQDAAGRFYVLSQCNRATLTVWPADTATGTTLSSLVILNLKSAVSNYDYLAAPRGGTRLANFVDLVYPSSSDTKLVYARIQLAGRRRRAPGRVAR